MLAFAFAEGAGNDWIGVALIDDHGAASAVGTLALAAFLTAMTTGRWFGPGVLDRYGRVKTLRTQTLVALVGLGLFAFTGSPLFGPRYGDVTGPAGRQCTKRGAHH